MNLILASKSPRRIELLQRLGYDFTITPSNFDESAVDLSKNPTQGVEFLARGKAQAIFDSLESTADTVVLGADTIVVCDGKVMLKPKDESDAKDMLRKLSSRVHTVYTAVAFVSDSGTESFVEATDVYFFELSDEEINSYVATGEPMDKAGAYGVQGLGCTLVQKIDGDYYNVVGLPIARVARHLKKKGF